MSTTTGEPQPSYPAARHHDRVLELSACLCAWLVGAAGAMLLAGWSANYRAWYDPLPQTRAMVIAICLLGLLAGPWIPQHVVLRTLRALWKRATGRIAGPSPETRAVVGAIGPEDRPVTWILTAAAAVAAGGLTLLAIPWTALLARTHEYLLEAFLWGPTSLTVAEAGLTALGMLVPWAGLGLLAACLNTAHGVWNDHRSYRSGPLAGALLGLACGALAAEWLARHAMGGWYVVLSGTLPLFALAVVAVPTASRCERLAGSTAPEDAPQVPLTRLSGWPVMLALLACGVLIGAVLTVWDRLAQASVPRVWAFVQPGVWLALAMAVGVLLSAWRATGRRYAAAECGTALWLAAVANGASIVLAAACQLGARAGPEPLFREWLWPMFVGLCGLGLGYGLGYLATALRCRSSSQAIAHAQTFSALGLGVAVSVLFIARWGMPALGSLGLLAAGSLIALAVGGLMIIHDADTHVRGRGLRAMLVFATLPAGMILLPRAAVGWLRPVGSPPAVVREGPWLTVWLYAEGMGTLVRYSPLIEARVREPVRYDDTLVDGALLALRNRGTRACLIGRPVADPACWSRCGFQYVRVWAYDPAASSPPLVGQTGGPPAAEPALLQLRLVRRRYDLLAQWPVEPGHPANADLWTVEVFERLRSRTGPGGITVTVVPLQKLGLVDVLIVANTFRAAFEDHCAWALFAPPAEDPQLWLIGFQPPASLSDTTANGESYLYGPRPMRELFGRNRDLPVHSARSRALLLDASRRDPTGPARIAEYLRRRIRTTAPAPDA